MGALPYGLLFAVGLFLFFMSLDRGRQRSDDPLLSRLKGYGDLDEVSLDDVELQKPFSERVLKPGVETVGRLISSRTPEKSKQAMTIKLRLAGNPGGLTPEGFQAARYGAAIICFVLGLLVGLLLHSPVGLAVGAAVGAGLGYFFPMLWLNGQAEGRRKQIQKSLPDAMDLLTIASEAGLGFDQAVATITDKFQNPLTDEFRVVLRETQLGRPRLEALDEMGKRCGVEDVNNFVQAVIQSEQMGVGIAKILRIQATELRRKRRQRASEQAAQASLKMMLPMVGCIFPTIWIILLGPAVLVVMKARG